VQDKKNEVMKCVAGRTEELKEAAGAGCNVTYDVNWNSFSTTDALNFVDNICFHRLSMAYRTIGNDEVGKAALCKIRTVQVSNGAGPSINLQGPTLVIVGNFAKGLDGAVNDNEMAKHINAGLNIIYDRRMHALTQQQLPDRTKMARELLGGGSFEFTIDWDTLDTASSVEFVDDVCLQRVTSAFRGICASFGNEGQTTLRENVKRAFLRNSKRPTDRSMQFADGTFVVQELIDRNDAISSQINLINHPEMEEFLITALKLRSLQNLGTLRDKQIPERTGELADAFGQHLDYDVDYSSFTNDREIAFVDNLSCHRLNMACRCLPGGVKTALQKKLKVVRLKNVTDPSQKKIFVEGPALVMHCNYDKGLDGAFSDNEIGAVLKKYADQ